MSRRTQIEIVAALSLLTAACGHKATGQTVAVVNGEEISAGELNAEIALANLPPSVDKKKVSAQILQNLIDRHLLVQQAKQQGIDKTPEFISRERRGDQQLMIGMSSERQADSMKLPDQKAIDAFIAANPNMFAQREMLVLDQIQFDPPANPAVIEKLKGDHSLDALGATLTGFNIAYAKGRNRLDSATVPPQTLQQIAALPAGEPFIVPSNGKLVASVVTGHEPSPIAGDDARRLALTSLRRQGVGTAMQNQLKQLRAAAKIDYQPGYGPPAGPGGAKPAAK